MGTSWEYGSEKAAHLFGAFLHSVVTTGLSCWIEIPIFFAPGSSPMCFCEWWQRSWLTKHDLFLLFVLFSLHNTPLFDPQLQLTTLTSPFTHKQHCPLFHFSTSPFLQLPLIPCTKWRREANLTSSIGMPTAASTRPAVSRCTMGTTWSPWTWWHLTQRRPEPGSPAFATWWPASAMKTRWPNGSAHMTNIPFNVATWSAVSWNLSLRMQESFVLSRPYAHEWFLNVLDVVETDVRGGRQERRRTPKHWRDLPTPPQAERQPAAEEGQADVSGQKWSNRLVASHICYFLTRIWGTRFRLRHHQRWY